MKPAGKFTIFVFTFVALAASANAQSPREQLQQMVEQLQKTPSDNALRERIIKLGTEIKPAPAIPEEAVRRMARGAAAFKSATSAVDYQDAAKEFEQTVLAAPWFADAYFNLGVAQDKAGNYEAALRSLKLAQLASPDSKEIKALIYEVEYRHEKLNDVSARLGEPFRMEMQGFRAGNRWFCFAKYDIKDGRFERWVVFDGTTAKMVSVKWRNGTTTPTIDTGDPLNPDRTAPRQFWYYGMTQNIVYTISPDGQLVTVVHQPSEYTSPAEAGKDFGRYSCTRK